MGLDYYGILECTQASTESEINKAYRRLSLKYHPTKNTTVEAVSRFHLLSEAYEVISNPLYRAVYDQFGDEGLKSGIPVEHDDGTVYSEKYEHHGNPHRTFETFFGGDNPWEQFFREGASVEIYSDSFRQNSVPKDSMEFEYPLSLKEMYTGCTKATSFKDLGLDSLESDENKTFKVIVKPGTYEDTKFVLPSVYNTENGMGPVSVVLVAKEIAHPHMKRDGVNLIYETSVTLADALTGCYAKVQTLDGRILNIQVNEIIHPKYEKIVPGEGMPYFYNPDKYGDLILRFNIKFPSKLTQSDKKNIKNLFKNVS